MVNIQRTQDDLNGLLLEQIEFIKLSAHSFDRGFQAEIKRLAVSVRVLVHDTAKSTSLLTLCNKKGINFFDSADPYDDRNKLSHSSLVQIHMTNRGGLPMAHLDDSMNPRWIDFDAWWNGIVLVDSTKNEFSRKDIVLYLANKDGGAHVDHQIDELYDKLRNNNSLGWVMTFTDGRQIAGEDQVPATMRQIGHEILKTLDQNYSLKQEVGSDVMIVTRGASLTEGVLISDVATKNMRKDRPKVNGKKIGRNDICPCGSKRKFKYCCI